MFRRAERVVCGLTLAAAATALGLVGGIHPVAGPTRIALGTVTVLLVGLASLQLVLSVPHNTRGISTWRVGPWFLLWAMLSYGIASFTWLGPQEGLARRVDPASVATALTLVTIAGAMWTVGYLSGAPVAIGSAAGRGMDQLLRGTGPRIRGGALPWLLYGLGTAARATTVLLSGGIGYVSDPRILVVRASWYGNALNIVATMAIFGVAVAAYAAFTDPSPAARLRLCVLAAAETVAGALAGGKESFVMVILAILVPYGAVRGRLSPRIIAAAVVVFLCVAIPFNASYRKVVRGSNSFATPTEAAAQAPQLFADTLDAGFLDTLRTSSQRLLLRVREIDNIAIVTQLTPSTIPYRSPGTFAVDPLIGLIPRALWPAKPLGVDGNEFGQEYYGLPRTVYSSSAVTPIGDLYRHGGWTPLILGMVLIGMGCRLFDTLIRPEQDPRAIFFLLVFLPVLVKFEIDISGLLRSLPTGVLAAVIGIQLSCRSRSTPAPAPGRR